MADGFVAQRQRHTQAGRDTVNVTVVPIIFIPGVMGSRLLMPGGRDWDPDANGTMVSWAMASLEEKMRDLSVDRRPFVEVSQIFAELGEAGLDANADVQRIASALDLPARNLYSVRGWAGISWKFYGTILPLLEATFNTKSEPQRNPVYAFGYDFRRSNFDSGDQLLDFIARVLKRHPGGQQVIVVTHSMGGLVARAALARNPGVVASIRGIVHGAQPSNGAVVAYRRFFTGAVQGLDGGGAIADRVVRAVLGTNPTEYATLQSGLPGPLQLLPNQIFHTFQAGLPWLQTAAPSDLGRVFEIYAEPTAPGLMLATTGTPDFVQNTLINSALQARLQVAESFHAQVAPAWHPATHVYYSDGVSTDAHIDWTEPNPFLGAGLKAPSGDGTVPADSGRCPGLPSDSRKSIRAFTGLEHSAVYGDVNFNAQVVTAVRMLLSGA